MTCTHTLSLTPSIDTASPPRRWSFRVDATGVSARPGAGLPWRHLPWSRLLSYLPFAEPAPRVPRRPLLSVTCRSPIAEWAALTVDVYVDRPLGLVLLTDALSGRAVLYRWRHLASLALV